MYQYTWLTPQDRAELADVVDLVVLVSADDPFLGLPARPTDQQTAQLHARLRDGLAAGATQVLAVRTSAGEVVGCVAVNRPATSNQGHIGELTTGAVHPGHRGKRVVTGAFGEIVRHCEHVGIELLRLDVRQGIRAERLWRAYGFQEYGRLADYGRVDGHSYTGIYLAQPVSRLRRTIVDQEVTRCSATINSGPAVTS